MKRAWMWLLLVAAVGCQPMSGLDCGISRTQTYPEPPAGSYTAGTFQLKIGETAVPVPGATVSVDFLRVTMVQPLLGRVFVDGDSAPGAARVAILSRELWEKRFAGAPDVIGRTVDIDGQPATVVGITPAGFGIPKGAQLWLLKGGGMP